MPEAHLPDVTSGRLLDNSDDLKAALQPGTRVVIIDAGWIGLETAAAARTAGAQVTLLERAELPLLAVLDRLPARVFAERHTDHGVDLRFDGVAVIAIRLTLADPATTDTVVPVDDTELPADVVIIIGVGVTPNVELARSCGLNVTTASSPASTSDNDIPAARRRRQRLPPAAGPPAPRRALGHRLHQPVVAAKTLCSDRPTPTTGRPYFVTDQYDLGMDYVGYTDPGRLRPGRGETANREFIAFRPLRTRGDRNERQYLGGDRADPRPDPIRRTDRCRPD